MIIGLHAILFTDDPVATRSFLRGTLGLDSVDAGDGWLIFAGPLAEVAVHPAEGQPHHEVYLMCDDIHATVADLEAKGAEFVEGVVERSEEHTSELQSQSNLVCRLLLEKKKTDRNVFPLSGKSHHTQDEP